jgi:hypothetical protein
MSLFERHVAFVGALRTAGITVSIAEGLDAAAAVRVVPLIDREQLRAAYAATLLKRQLQRPLFDGVFDLYFPPVLGHSVANEGPDAWRGAEPDRIPPAPWEVDDPIRLRLRAELADYLRTGDEQLAAAIAREAVAAFGAAPGTDAGRTSWSRVTVLDRLSPQTLMAGLLAEFLAGAPSGGLAERVARTTIDGRIRRFGHLVESDVRRRMAEQAQTSDVARTAIRPSIDRVAFLSATKTELAQLRREVQPLARRLATRLAADQRHGRRGQLDFRRTVRASLASGGVPLTTHHRPRRPAKTDLVVLCDVSESVASFAHFTLLLMYALREQFSRVRTFAFVDKLDEVTAFFAPGADVVDAVTALTQRADVVGLYGRTDYGRAIEQFATQYPDAIGRRSSVLILGDARSNYGDLAIPVLTRLVDQARHAFWLNPERQQLWDTGDSAASAYATVMPMVECRNLEQLGSFVRGLV